MTSLRRVSKGLSFSLAMAFCGATMPQGMAQTDPAGARLPAETTDRQTGSRASDAPPRSTSETRKTDDTGVTGRDDIRRQPVDGQAAVPAAPSAKPPEDTPSATEPSDRPGSSSAAVTFAQIEATALLADATSDDARAVITANGGTPLSETVLASFGRQLLVYRAPQDRLPEIEAALKALDAEAVVGQRSVYRLSQSAPRLYARALVGWPQTHACHGGDIAIGVIDGPAAEDALHTEANLTQMMFGTGPDQPGALAHGTAVTGLIVGGREGSEPGLLPGARVSHAAVFRDADGGPRSEIDLIAAGVDWLKSRDVRLINFSFAGPYNPVFAALLDQLSGDGVVLVAAAGNTPAEAEQGDAFPAEHPLVLAVTSVDARMVAARDANRGAFVDLAAPGVDVYAPVRGGGRYVSGTSYAAPYVTALLALEISHLPHLSPEISGLLLKESAIDLGDAGHDAVFGAGLVQMRDGLCAPEK
ncbi:S8 family serine peptidase [Pyruvatibacter mobilis]|uniref:S8 family serine peptidase n=1 Tax=Pyruvatibacter mobilis TaxID=1712261 RepID=UPI003C79A0BC